MLELISEEASQTLTTGFDLFYPSHGSQRSLLSSLLKREIDLHCNPNNSSSILKEDPFLFAVLATLSSRRNVSALFSPFSKQISSSPFTQSLRTPHRTLRLSFPEIFDEPPEKEKVKGIFYRLLKVVGGSINRFFHQSFSSHSPPFTKTISEDKKGMNEGFCISQDICAALKKQSFPIVLVVRILR